MTEILTYRKKEIQILTVYISIFFGMHVTNGHFDTFSSGRTAYLPYYFDLHFSVVSFLIYRTGKIMNTMSKKITELRHDA